MSNVQVSISPVQLRYNNPEPLNLTLVYKRSLISTGHQIEKYECPTPFLLRNGVASINNTASFNLSKELELKNTLIQVQVISKKGRDCNFLGQVKLDAAKLSDKAHSEHNIHLNSSADPAASLSFKVDVQEQQVKNSKNQSPKMVETGMLETESYRKEALLLARRAQPHILTAHEISQRNYGGGNLKTTNSTSRDLSQRSNESNRSYSKQYHALNSHVGNYNTTGQIGNSKMDRHIIQAPRCNPARIEQLAQPKKTVSPSPRRRTPEPILSLEPQPSLVKGYKIGQNPSRVGNGNVSYGYSREKHTQVGNKANRSHLVTQTMAEQIEEDETPRLDLRPQPQHWQYKDTTYQLSHPSHEFEQQSAHQLSHQPSHQLSQRQNDYRYQSQPVSDSENIRDFNTFASKDQKYKSLVDKLALADHRIRNQIEQSAESLNGKYDKGTLKDAVNLGESNCSGTFHEASSYNDSLFSDGDNLEKQKRNIVKESESSHYQSSSQESHQHQSPQSNTFKDQSNTRELEQLVGKEKGNVQMGSNGIAFSREWRTNTTASGQVGHLQSQNVGVAKDTKECSVQSELDVDELARIRQERDFARKCVVELEFKNKEQAKFHSDQMLRNQQVNQSLQEQNDNVKQLCYKLQDRQKAMEVELQDKSRLIDKLRKLYEGQLVSQKMNTQEYVAQKEQKELQELREYNKGLQDTVREMEKILANIQQKPSINDSRPCQKCVETEAILGAHKQQLVKEQKKSVNLQTELRFKENQIKFLKLEKDNLVKEKSDLQAEIQDLARNNRSELARKGSISKLNLQSNSVLNSVKMQNQALKGEVALLQQQIKSLNSILSNSNSQHGQIQPSVQHDKYRKVLEEKYAAVHAKCEALQQELGRKKHQFADLINIIWKNGNAELMEEIDRSITQTN